MRSKMRISILVSLAVVGFVLWLYIFTHPIGGEELQQIPQDSVEVKDKKEEPQKESKETVSALVCGTDETGLLTDVIFLAMYDVDKKQVNLLQIPRDSYVGEEYPSGKINAVYGKQQDYKDGIKALENIIEEQFLVPVDYTAVISLDAFKNIIDGLGGVRMVVDRQINYTPGKVLYEGEQVLSGEQCEWIVRYRKGYLTGDIGRMEQQKKFLSALINTVREQGRMKAVSLLTKNYSSIKTDMPKSKAISYANKVFLEVEDENINVFTAEGEGLYSGRFAVYQLKSEPLAEILNQWFRPYSEKVPEDKLNLAKVPNPIYPEYNNIKEDVNMPTEEEKNKLLDDQLDEPSEDIDLGIKENILKNILEEYINKREDKPQE